MDRKRILACALPICLLAIVLGWTIFETARTDAAVATLAVRQATVAQAVAALPTQQVGERVINLPEDGGQWHLSLFLDDNWRNDPAARELSSWFASDPALMNLRAQVQWHTYTPRDPMYGLRYGKSINALPSVWLQDSQGRMIYKVSGPAIPSTPQELSDQIANQIQFFRPCPRPNPSPAPPTPPNIDIDVVPDVKPAVPAADKVVAGDFPWGILIGACVAAGVLTVYVNVKREMHP